MNTYHRLSLIVGCGLLLSCAVAGASTTVTVPSDYSSGTNSLAASTPFLSSAKTIQYVYKNTDVSALAGGQQITQIGFFVLGTGPTHFTNWDIQFSRTTAATTPGGLSTTFASNFDGTDTHAVTGRSGLLTISPVANQWLMISLTTPYVYTSGNLLITIRHSGGLDAGNNAASLSVDGIDPSLDPSTKTNAVSAGGYIAASGSVLNYSPRMRLVGNPVPEPAGAGLLVGLATIGLRRRARARAARL